MGARGRDRRTARLRDAAPGQAEARREKAEARREKGDARRRDSGTMGGHHTGPCKELAHPQTPLSARPRTTRYPPHAHLPVSLVRPPPHRPNPARPHRRVSASIRPLAAHSKPARRPTHRALGKFRSRRCAAGLRREPRAPHGGRPARRSERRARRGSGPAPEHARKLRHALHASGGGVANGTGGDGFAVAGEARVGDLLHGVLRGDDGPVRPR